MKSPYRRPGFSLPELLVVVAIVAVLATIGIMIGRRSIQTAKHAADLGKLRNIGTAVMVRSVENNDRCYTKAEIGNSMYREWKDPLSLCQILKDSLPETAWVSPAATKHHKTYKNSYAWSVAASVTTKTLSQVANPQSTILLWNNFAYTLPSVYNVPEGSSGGPRQAPKFYHYRPWNGGKAVNWYFLDGHVETF